MTPSVLSVPRGSRDKSHMNFQRAVKTDAAFWRSWTSILAVGLTAIIVAAVSFAPHPTSVPISGKGCPAAGYGLIVDAAPPNSAISFCEHGNEDRLSIATTAPMHNRYVHLSYIGYPHTAGEKIALRSTSGEELRLELPTAGRPGDRKLLSCRSVWSARDTRSSGKMTQQRLSAGLGWGMSIRPRYRSICNAPGGLR
jgi:hypothetical protein